MNSRSLAPLLAAALCLGAALPAEARDNSFLYGTANPNTAQVLNKHFSLLEIAMQDMLVRVYNDEQSDAALKAKGFTPRAKTGYPPDRKIKADQWFHSYQLTLTSFRKTPADTKIPAAFAAKQRKGLLREIASGYLAQTANGKGEPEKLSDFESDFLVSYFKWTTDEEFLKFKREWIEVTVPRSPEEHWLLRERVSHCRAVLRSQFRGYLDSPPSGVVSPSAEFAHVEALLKILLQEIADKLKEIYAKAGMQLPVKPVPPTSPGGQAPLPFVKRFTPLEHAVLTYAISSPAPLAEFKKDEAAADKDAAKAPELVAKWVKTAKADISGYLKSTAPQANKDAACMERFTPFEATYIQWRLKPVDPGLWEQLERLAGEADAALKAGDQGAPDRLVHKLRALVRADLAAYEKSGQKAAETLPAWAKANLKPATKFAVLFPNPNKPPQNGPNGQPGQPGQPAVPTVADLFKEPVEKAVVEFLVSQPGAEKDKAALLEALKKPEDPKSVALRQQWEKKVQVAVNDQLTKPEKKFGDFLQNKGIKEKELLAYLCPRLAKGSAAQPGSTPAMVQLGVTEKMSKEGKTAANDEAAASAVSNAFGPSAEVSALCKKFNETTAINTPTPTPTGPTLGAGTNVPDPGSASQVINAPPGGDAKKPSGINFKLEGGEARDAVALSALSGGVMGLLAMGAAAGPVGILFAALFGAALGYGYSVVQKNTKD